MQAVPDIATLRIEMSQENASLDTASAQVRKGMTDIMERLRREGILEKDIQTESYSVTPRYEQDKLGNPHRAGFRVSNRIAAKIRDLRKVGRILGSVSEANAASVTGPDFDLDNPASLQRAALAKAMEDARVRAAVLASAAGAALGGIWTINESNVSAWSGPRPLMAMRAMAVPSEAAEPIAAGEQTIQATITATFLLK